MYQKLKPFLLKYWPVLIIVATELILFLTNFKPGTFVIGWDNLYPELDFGLNLKRTLFSAWQEYRNLGYFDGMSQAANLPNDLFRLFLGIFLPTNLIRWVFIFLMHLLGGVGMYFLMVKYIFKSVKESTAAKATSLIAALFYQYNFATIQMFFLPFELFLVHFAALPWLLLTALAFLESRSKKDLLWFTLASILSIPQAHVPTIFIVYLMVLSLLLFVKFIQARAQNWKAIILLVIITFCINAFWGIPFALSTAQNAGIIANSKNNQMSTDDIFYRNNKYGGFQDTATLRGLSLDYLQYNFKTNRSEFMMAPWIKHLQTPLFNIPAWTFFVVAVLGFIESIRRKQKNSFAFGALFVFSFLMMGTDVPGFSIVSEVLRDHVPLFHNIFRFVFTKFSILYAFGYSIFLGLGFYYLALLSKKAKIVTIAVACALLLFYTLPSFQGHFFYENLAAKMPADYEKTFEFFQQQDPTKRIASLPIPWYWAWTQNNWNTIGSGFIWYGLPQPITDRAFDPWNDKNENFYWELEQAIYSQNIGSLDTVLNKYDVEWILYDKSVYNASAPKYTESRYEDLLKSSPNIQLYKQFGNILIYRHIVPTSLNNFVGIKSSLPEVTPSYKYDNIDQAYTENKDYVSGGKSADIEYPFRSLFSGKKASDEEFSVQETPNELNLTKSLGKEWSNQTLVLPAQTLNDLLIFNNTKVGEKKYFSISVYINNKLALTLNQQNSSTQHSIRLPNASAITLKITLEKSQTALYDTQKDAAFLQPTNGQCNNNTDGTADKKVINLNNDKAIQFSSQHSNNCIDLNLSNLYQEDGYLIQVKAKNIATKGLFMGIINQTTRKTDMETYFDNDGKEHSYSFILNPRNQYGLGYTLHFDNISFGKEKVVNILEDLKVYKVPFTFLKDLKVVKNTNQTFEPITSTDQVQKVDHPTPNKYIISLKNTGDQIAKTKPNTFLYISQGYNPYWIAYSVNSTSWFSTHFPFIAGKKIAGHEMVNNWANGWNLDGVNSSYVVLIFWPQYLIYAGLVLLLATVAVIGYKSRSHNSLKSDISTT